jgi:adenylosuccinate lyase
MGDMIQYQQVMGIQNTLDGVHLLQTQQGQMNKFDGNSVIQQKDIQDMLLSEDIARQQMEQEVRQQRKKEWEKSQTDYEMEIGRRSFLEKIWGQQKNAIINQELGRRSLISQLKLGLNLKTANVFGTPVFPNVFSSTGVVST